MKVCGIEDAQIASIQFKKKSGSDEIVCRYSSSNSVKTELKKCSSQKYKKKDWCQSISTCFTSSLNRVNRGRKTFLSGLRVWSNSCFTHLLTLSIFLFLSQFLTGWLVSSSVPCFGADVNIDLCFGSHSNRTHFSVVYSLPVLYFCLEMYCNTKSLVTYSGNDYLPSPFGNPVFKIFFLLQKSIFIEIWN